MKRIVSILLCFAILSACSPERRQAQAQTAAAVFVVTIIAIGLGATIYILQKYGENKTRWFRLEKGYLDGNWTPVATNALRMTVGHAFATFEVLMTDPIATYRVVEIPQPTNYFHIQFVSGRLENPIIQQP